MPEWLVTTLLILLFIFGVIAVVGVFALLAYVLNNF